MIVIWEGANKRFVVDSVSTLLMLLDIAKKVRANRATNCSFEQNDTIN